MTVESITLDMARTNNDTVRILAEYVEHLIEGYTPAEKLCAMSIAIGREIKASGYDLRDATQATATMIYASGEE